jgi:hypothetical protein
LERQKVNIRNTGIKNLILALIFIIALLTIPVRPAFSQGFSFMVKPMKIELSVRPGQTVETILELRSTATQGTEILDLRLVDLTQTSQGGVQAVESGADINTPSSFSCLQWARLSDESVTVEAMQVAYVTLTIKAPAGVRGFYAAGILAQRRVAPKDKTVSIVFRFLIGILIDIQGRPERQKIDLNDVGMRFRQKSENETATTFASLGVANQGRTYSRIKGSAGVMRFSDGHWRKVTNAEFKELGILPGVKLNLESDLSRRLPTGKYKLTGTLYVDGRRVKPVEKEIDFVGDPDVTKLAVDTALTLDPPVVAVVAAPGANRTSMIKVENASEDAVNIEATSAVPPVLRGVALGDLKGEDLSCAEWVKVSPSKFTLRAGGRQNIGLTVKMPNTANQHSNYYALLGLRANYPDGQSAGETTTLISVENKQAKAKPVAQVMKVTLAAEEPSKYIVRGKFANIGDVHFTPKCTAVVTTAPGASVVQAEMSGETSIMLPLETRDFSGVLDFSKVSPGTYFLKASIEYAPRKMETAELPIQVSIDENQARVVEIIKPAEKEAEPAGKTPETGK